MMEIKSEVGVDDGDDHHHHDMQLPPGFRFHPTDEELITHYLSNKVIDPTFSAIAIGEVDMNKIEPWDLPCELFSRIYVGLLMFLGSDY